MSTLHTINAPAVRVLQTLLLHLSHLSVVLEQ